MSVLAFNMEINMTTDNSGINKGLSIIVNKNSDFDSGVATLPGLHIDGTGIAVDAFNFGLSLAIEQLNASMVDVKDNPEAICTIVDAIKCLKAMKV